MVKCYLEAVEKIGTQAALPSSHKRDNKLTAAVNEYNCNGELQRYIANKRYSSYPSRVGNRDEEVKEQQGPKKKRERAKASSEASSEASCAVKWWDQATWTEKEWKPYNKRAEKLRALNAEVKKTNENASWPSQVTYDNLMKRIGSILRILAR